MARTQTTTRKSTGGRVPWHQLAPHEPRPEPTVEERLREELAEVTAEWNVVQQHLEQSDPGKRSGGACSFEVDICSSQLWAHAGPRVEPAEWSLARR
jgi:hypothetical protein